MLQPRPTWLAAAEFFSRVLAHPADPGLRDDLAGLRPDTLQDVVEMRAAGHGRLGVQDAWIAATAITHDADLLTRDDDFDAVPGLRVIKL